MELEGTVNGGIIVPDDASQLPEDGTRVQIATSTLPKDIGRTKLSLRTRAKSRGSAPRLADDPRPTLGELLKDFEGICLDLPPDFADQHDHYIYGTPKK